MKLPNVAENPDGLHQHYSVKPLYKPYSPNDVYVVLKLNVGSDPKWTTACREAAIALATHYLALKGHPSQVAYDLLKLVDELEKEHPLLDS